MCASKENQILLEKHSVPKGKEQFDGILDELAAAAQAEDEGGPARNIYQCSR